MSTAWACWPKLKCYLKGEEMARLISIGFVHQAHQFEAVQYSHSVCSVVTVVFRIMCWGQSGGAWPASGFHLWSSVFVSVKWAFLRGRHRGTVGMPHSRSLMLVLCLRCPLGLPYARGETGRVCNRKPEWASLSSHSVRSLVPVLQAQ